MGVAMMGCGVIANFHLDAKMGPVACFSQNITKGVVSYHHITATLTSGGMMSQRVKALPGQSAHWDPWEVSIPSHHFMATSWTGASRCRPSPCDGRTDSQDDACGAETESNRTWSALEEVSNSRLNMQVSNVLDSSFWETRDAERRE